MGLGWSLDNNEKMAHSVGQGMLPLPRGSVFFNAKAARSLNPADSYFPYLGKQSPPWSQTGCELWLPHFPAMDPGQVTEPQFSYW